MVVEGLTVDRGRAGWYALGIALLCSLAYVAYSFVGTFVFAFFIYYATRPIYARIRTRVRQPSIAAATSLFALILPVLLLFAYTLAIATQEFTAATTEANITQLNSFVEPYANVSVLVQQPEHLLDQPGARQVFERVLDQGIKTVGFLGTGALHLFVMLALAFYMLKDGRKLSRWTRSKFGDQNGILAEFMRGVDNDFKNIFFGNILNAIMTGAIGATSYTILDAFVFGGGINIPYAALVGVLTGAASLIPVIGMKIVYFPVAGWLFFEAFQKGGGGLYLYPVLFVAVSFLIVDVIPDLVLRPYVSGRNLHTGAVMFAYIFGPLLFGWYGLFLGPMILVFAVHFAKTVLPELIADRHFEPVAVDPSYMTGPVLVDEGESVADAGGGIGGPVPDGSDGPLDRGGHGDDGHGDDGRGDGDDAREP